MIGGIERAQVGFGGRKAKEIGPLGAFAAACDENPRRRIK
jgi:hypothetical protein